MYIVGILKDFVFEFDEEGEWFVVDGDDMFFIVEEVKYEEGVVVVDKLVKKKKLFVKVLVYVWLLKLYMNV